MAEWQCSNEGTGDGYTLFTPEIRFDVNYTSSFNHPKDNTIGGSSEIFRSGEVQLTQIGVGGDFHYNNVRGRLMTQLGMYSQTTPRNDASPGRGQWNLDNAYRYVSESVWRISHRQNARDQCRRGHLYVLYRPCKLLPIRQLDLPALVCLVEHSMVLQWLAYSVLSHQEVEDSSRGSLTAGSRMASLIARPGIGGQILYRPNGNTSIVLNNYYGSDTLGNPGRKRFHTDDSNSIQYYDKPDNTISKAASRSPSTRDANSGVV